jgi:hypothetical protein
MNNQRHQNIQSKGLDLPESQLNQDVGTAQMKPVQQGHSIEDQAIRHPVQVHHTHSKPKTWDDNTEPLIVTKGEEIKGNLQTGEISNANRVVNKQAISQKGGMDQYYELLDENFIVTKNEPIQNQNKQVSQQNQFSNDYEIQGKPMENVDIPVEEAQGIGQAFTESAKITYETLKEDLAATKQMIEQSEIVQTVEQKLSDAGHAITNTLGELGQTVTHTYEKTKEDLPKMYESVKETATDIGKNITEKIHQARESETGHMIEEKVSTIAQGTKQILVTAGEKINEAFDTISETITEALMPPEDLLGEVGPEYELKEQYQIGQKDDLVAEYSDAIKELKAHHNPNINVDDVKLANTEHTISKHKIKSTKNPDNKELIEEYDEVVQELAQERHPRVNRGEVKIATTPTDNLETHPKVGQEYHEAIQELNQGNDIEAKGADFNVGKKLAKNQNLGQQNNDLTQEYADVIEELDEHSHVKINLDDVKLANSNQQDISKK